MRLAILGLCVAVMALALLPQSASAIKLTDYKFPESTSQQAYLLGGWNTADQSGGGQTAYNLNGAGTYELNFRSLPFTYRLATSATAAVQRSGTPGDKRNGSYDLVINSNANKYIRETSDIFGYGSTKFEYRAQAGAPPDDPYWDITVGAGVGRTIDATVLWRAIRLNEDFLKYGVIKTDIPDEALLELAGIIDRESEYQTRYGTVEYRKYWYEDMEEVVRKSGVLKGDGLGAIGVIRISEVLQEPQLSPRAYGWDARAGVGVVVSDFNGKSGDPVLEAGLDWEHPAALKLQFNDNFLLTGVFHSDPVYTMTNLLEGYYQVSNRVQWDNRLTTTLDIPTASGLSNVFTTRFTSAYIFYVANQVDFSPSFVYDRIHSGSVTTWDWTFSGNITYRLR